MSHTFMPGDPAPQPLVAMSEEKIMSSWVDRNEIKVSICCVTYNHEPYIRDAINGFLAQKTDFAYEVLIHDDASTDGTADIIREYERTHPHIVKPIYQKENQYSKGVAVGTYIRERVKGAYTALCDGDDYWTDQNKLNNQVAFMLKNADCSVCFHAAIHYDFSDPGNSFIKHPQKKQGQDKFLLRHCILKGGGFITTNSILYKSEYLKETPDWYDMAPVKDSAQILILGVRGKIGYIDKVMSVYRRHVTGSWTSSNKEKDRYKKHNDLVGQMYDNFNRWTGNKFFLYVKIKKLINRYLYFKKSLKYLLG